MSNDAVRQAFDQWKVCVLIPTYNNAATLSKVISDVARYTSNIIVVNDGSTDATASILSGLSVTRVVSYEKNRGKGYALRTGFQEALQLGFDYAITIDSDGQHYADDLPVFLDQLLANTNAIMIGARNMEQSSVPGKSSFGNKFSNFWFWVETGRKMKDTQSGFRLYPIKSMRRMSFITRKYEFEIEVLVRSSWAGIDIIQVPVKVFYPTKEERVSHFRPFRDFSRISVLNTFLVTIALFWIKPRDLYRNLKKKTSGRSFANFSSILTSPMHLKPLQ